MFDKTMVRGLLAVALLASAVSVRADVFNMGGTNPTTGTWTGLASLSFVTVGDPGNAARPDDRAGYGSGRLHLPDGQVRRDAWPVLPVPQRGREYGYLRTVQLCTWLTGCSGFPTFGITQSGSSGKLHAIGHGR